MTNLHKVPSVIVIFLLMLTFVSVIVVPNALPVHAFSSAVHVEGTSTACASSCSSTLSLTFTNINSTNFVVLSAAQSCSSNAIAQFVFSDSLHFPITTDKATSGWDATGGGAGPYVATAHTFGENVSDSAVTYTMTLQSGIGYCPTANVIGALFRVDVWDNLGGPGHTGFSIRTSGAKEGHISAMTFNSSSALYTTVVAAGNAFWGAGTLTKNGSGWTTVTETGSFTNTGIAYADPGSQTSPSNFYWHDTAFRVFVEIVVEYVNAPAAVEIVTLPEHPQLGNQITISGCTVYGPTTIVTSLTLQVIAVQPNCNVTFTTFTGVNVRDRFAGGASTWNFTTAAAEVAEYKTRDVYYQVNITFTMTPYTPIVWGGSFSEAMTGSFGGTPGSTICTESLSLATRQCSGFADYGTNVSLPTSFGGWSAVSRNVWPVNNTGMGSHSAEAAQYQAMYVESGVTPAFSFSSFHSGYCAAIEVFGFFNCVSYISANVTQGDLVIVSSYCFTNFCSVDTKITFNMTGVMMFGAPYPEIGYFVAPQTGVLRMTLTGYVDGLPLSQADLSYTFSMLVVQTTNLPQPAFYPDAFIQPIGTFTANSTMGHGIGPFHFNPASQALFMFCHGCRGPSEPGYVWSVGPNTFDGNLNFSYNVLPNVVSNPTDYAFSATPSCSFSSGCGFALGVDLTDWVIPTYTVVNCPAYGINGTLLLDLAIILMLVGLVVSIMQLSRRYTQQTEYQT